MIEIGSGEDGADNAGTMDGRVRVHRTDNDFDLRVDLGAFLRVGGNEGEGTDTLSVETHVL